MLLKYFYDQALAHASYLVGCQRAKVAVVVDPGRDIDTYLEAAQREGLQLIAAAENSDTWEPDHRLRRPGG